MNTKEEHEHNWRAYGQPDGTIVCDGCNVGTDVNILIKSRESALLSRVREEVIGGDLADEEVDDYVGDMLKNSKVAPDAIPEVRTMIILSRVFGINQQKEDSRTKLDQLSKGIK